MASAFDQERIYKIFSFFYGAVFLWLGFWALQGLVPVILDPDIAQAVLIDLPAQHFGMSATARIGLLIALIAASIAAMIWGAISVTRATRKGTARINGIILAQLAIVFVFLEVGMRVGIEREVPFSLFNNPAYLANPVCGDTYYRLMREPGDAHAGKAFDPLLGWTGKPVAGNPEGLRWPATIDDRPKAWFFGDSFVAGVGNAYQSVPALYENRNPGTQALNYGVPGYGLDQIWLRYQQKAPDIAAGSSVFIGVLTTDLDRSVLEYFYGFKPVFREQESGYSLSLPPAPEEAARRLADSGELVDSYALAVLRSLAELIQTGFDRSEAPCFRDEKIALNRYLIGKIITESEQHKHDLRWIVFTGHSAYVKPKNWRYDFLTETLRDHGQKLLDTRKVLECNALASGARPESYFIPNDGHLNPKGNAVVASGLSDLVAGRSPACPATR